MLRESVIKVAIDERKLVILDSLHLGNTPLHESAKNPNSLSLTILLISGSNVDAINNKGYTALHIASKVT